jgi:Uma2 family endonuclease
MPQGATAAPTRGMSLAEWARLPEDEPGELVEERLVEEEVPDAVHETIVRWLLVALSTWIVPRGGLSFGSELKYAVQSTRGRKPDLSAYFPGRVPPRRGLVRVPPDLMIEIVSPSPRDARRDRVEKLGEYAAFGVRFYWIVDPGLRLLEIYELGDNGRYQHALGAGDGEIASIPGCDGLTLDLDAMWAELDRLGMAEEDEDIPPPRA